MMEKVELLSLMSTLIWGLSGVSCFTFWASPQRIHVRTGGDVTITCGADVDLIDCRFYLPGLGYLEPIPHQTLVFRGTTLEYFKTNKNCSVSLRSVDVVFYDLIACRGRDQNGVYKAAEMSLAVSNFDPFDLEIDTKDRVGVVLPGSDFSFVCRSPHPLILCQIWIPNGNILDLSKGAATEPNNATAFQYEYYGSGLGSGECGIKFKRVTNQLNGVLWCSTKATSSNAQFDYTTLIVATAPERIQLDANVNDLVEGDTLKATCSALNARPIPSIKWYMGDDVITSGVSDVTVESPFWPDPHNAMSLTQTLTRLLTAADNGKQLKCVVSHVALPGGRKEVMKLIKVKSSSAFTWTSNPRHVYVRTGGEVTILCESNVPLDDCRFRLPEVGFLDFSTELRDDVTAVVPMVNRTYHFRGTTVEYFWRGQTCGLTFKGANEDLEGVVSCRGRNQFGVYKTADMALAVSKLVPFDFTADKHHAVLLPGQNFTLLCRSPLPLIYCAIWLPDDEILDLTEGRDSKPSGTHGFRYEYHGAGLDSGECGVTFTDVTEELNGHVWCEGQSEDATDQSDYVTVVVARKPNPPVLLTSPSQYNIGDSLEASCDVRNARPAPTITWFLGGRQVTKGVRAQQDATTWGWEFDKRNVVQKLSLVLKEEDAGLELKCVASHVMYPGGSTESKKVKIGFTMNNNSADPSFHPNKKLINSESCGKIPLDLRITGGRKTGLFEFPWMALLIYDTTHEPVYGCGGSLIARQYVLTAAHCVTNLPKGYKFSHVRLGEHNYETEIDCQEKSGKIICAPPPQNFTPMKIISHPGFTSTELTNDVALVKLDRPALLTDSVGTICLPSGRTMLNLHKTFKTMVVAGWGITERGAQSVDLRSVQVPLVSNQLCAEMYVKRQFLVGPTHVCAGGKDGQDSCKGDSGGPLMAVDAAQGKFFQHGIVSYGGGVCGTSVPTVYTNVVYFIGWMLDNMG